MENQTEESVSKKTFSGFLWLFFSGYISMIGSQLVSFSVTWYLTEETGSTLILSLATLSTMLPMIIVSLFAGVIADRRSKNRILFIADATQAFATFILIMMFFFGVNDIWQILVLMGVRGACQGFQMPVAVSLNAIMVPKKHIQRINAVDRIFMSILSITTPLLGVVILEHMTIDQIYWFDVITFIPSAIALLLVKIPGVKSTGDEKIHFWRDFKDSVKYMKKEHLIPPFILFGLANFFVVPLFSLIPLLVEQHYAGESAQYGIMMMSLQIGMLIGGVILMFLKKKPLMKGVIINGFLMSFAVMLLVAVPSGWTWRFYTLYANAFIFGMLITFIDTQLVSILQLTIPKELQGRVFSSLFVIIKSIMPLGLVLWGGLGEITNWYFIFLFPPALSIVAFIILGLTTPIFKFDAIQREKEKNMLQEIPSEVVEEETTKE